MVAYTNLYLWYDHYHRQAVDSQQQQLCELRHLLSRGDHTLEQLLVILDKGRALAQRLNEPYWYVFFESRYCWDLLNYLHVDEGLERAARLMVEIQKPQYLDCPFLIRCYENLISAYTLYDPVGYAQEILDAIDYALSHLMLDAKHHLGILERRTDVYIALEEWEQAKKSGEEYQILAEVQSNTFNIAFSAIKLCHIAHKLRDEGLLAIQIDKALYGLKTYPDNSHWSAVLFWQAVLARQRNDIKAQNNFYDKAWDLAYDSRRGASSEAITAYFYCKTLQSGFGNGVYISTDLEVPPSPHSNYVGLIREYYIYTHQGIWSRWLNLGIEILPLKRGYELLTSVNIILGVILGLLIFVSIIPVGGFANVVIHPRRRAYQRVLRAAQAMKHPHFFLERIEQIRKRTGYIP